jgi:fructose-bisphosphate aldolase, class I
VSLQAPIDTAQAMLADGKGLLAIDESSGTCNRRLASVGIAQTVEMRRAWRELLLTTPDLGSCISGVILHDETIRQAKSDGTPFVEVARKAGLLVGIKVDTGAKALAAQPAEKVMEGLDGLRERPAATGAGHLGWHGRERGRSATRTDALRTVQLRGPERRVQRRHGG